MTGSVNRLDAKSMILCALFAALTAAGAFIKIPLGAMPITLQFLFANLAGLLLGGKRGAISVAVYVFIGLAGIPVFTGGGGPAYVLQPSFGFLPGMVLGTYIAGRFAEKGSGVLHLITAGAFNALAMYAVGLIYLYILMKYYIGTPLEIKTLVVSYCLVFLSGDVLKIVAGAFLAKKLRPLLP